MAYSVVDKEWVEGKRGIIDRDGIFVNLEEIGKRIARFREEVRKVTKVVNKNSESSTKKISKKRAPKSKVISTLDSSKIELLS